MKTWMFLILMLLTSCGQVGATELLTDDKYSPPNADTPCCMDIAEIWQCPAHLDDLDGSELHVITGLTEVWVFSNGMTYISCAGIMTLGDEIDSVRAGRFNTPNVDPQCSAMYITATVELDYERVSYEAIVEPGGVMVEPCFMIYP